MSEAIIKKLSEGVNDLHARIDREIAKAAGKHMNFTVLIWSDDVREIDHRTLLRYVHLTSIPADATAQVLRMVAENFEERLALQGGVTKQGVPKKAN